MLSAYEDGTTVGDLAELHGVSIPRVHQILTLRGDQSTVVLAKIRWASSAGAGLGLLETTIEEVVQDHFALAQLGGEARTRAMCDLYEEGLTLQAIGDIYGLTRERVRQLIKKVGGPSSDLSRSRRIEDRGTPNRGRGRTVPHLYRDRILGEAAQGTTRSQIESLILAVEPRLNREVLQRGIERSGAEFDKGFRDDLYFSDAVVIETVWFIAGLNNDAYSMGSEPLEHLEPPSSEELTQYLQVLGLSATAISAVLRTASGAKSPSDGRGRCTHEEGVFSRHEERFQGHFWLDVGERGSNLAPDKPDSHGAPRGWVLGGRYEDRRTVAGGSWQAARVAQVR